MRIIITIAFLLIKTLSFSQSSKDTANQDTIYIAQMPAQLFYSLMDDLAIQASGKANVNGEEWKALLKTLQSSARVMPYVPVKEKPVITKPKK